MIRTGKLPVSRYGLDLPKIGLRLRQEGWGCAISLDGQWIAASKVVLEADAKGVPHVVVTIPALDLTIETESEREAA